MQRKIIPDVISDQEIVSLPATASVREAARLMERRNVGSVLIMTGDGLEGIFTERDMVCRVVAQGLDPDETLLSQVMTKEPDTIAPGLTAIESLRMMQFGGYRHLPVIDGGRVVGVVSRRDFVGGEKARLDDESATWEVIG